MLLAIDTRADVSSACPDVSGRYSISGVGDTLGDTLDVLHAKQAGFADSGIELHGAVDGELTVGVKSGATGAWSTRAVAVLHEDTDFDCKDGALVVRPRTHTSRKTTDGIWYEGASTISLSRQGGEIAIGVRFTGTQRITLYSYESANVSIPRLGTRTTLAESIRWNAYTDPVVPPAPTPAETAELDVRGLLTAGVLGNVIMGWLGREEDGIEVTFNAPHSGDIAPFEQRLHAAAIEYRMKQPPIWTNGAYYMVLVIEPPHRPAKRND